MRTQAKPNAYNLRSWKLGALTPAQRQSLIGWLRDGGLTYAAARERLAKEFGVKASDRALSVFWQKYCVADRAKPVSQDSGVLLDVVIKSSSQVRLVVKKNGISLEY